MDLDRPGHRLFLTGESPSRPAASSRCRPDPLPGRGYHCAATPSPPLCRSRSIPVPSSGTPRRWHPVHRSSPGALESFDPSCGTRVPNRRRSRSAPPQPVVPDFRPRPRGQRDARCDQSGPGQMTQVSTAVCRALTSSAAQGPAHDSLPFPARILVSGTVGRRLVVADPGRWGCHRVRPHTRPIRGSAPDGTVGSSTASRSSKPAAAVCPSRVRSHRRAPPGLTLDAGGVISGTPTEAGSFTAAVIASQRHRAQPDLQVTIVIRQPTSVLQFVLENFPAVHHRPPPSRPSRTRLAHQGSTDAPRHATLGPASPRRSMWPCGLMAVGLGGVGSTVGVPPANQIPIPAGYWFVAGATAGSSPSVRARSSRARPARSASGPAHRRYGPDRRTAGATGWWTRTGGQSSTTATRRSSVFDPGGSPGPAHRGDGRDARTATATGFWAATAACSPWDPRCARLSRRPAQLAGGGHRQQPAWARATGLDASGEVVSFGAENFGQRVDHRGSPVGFARRPATATATGWRRRPVTSSTSATPLRSAIGLTSIGSLRAPIVGLARHNRCGGYYLLGPTTEGSSPRATPTSTGRPAAWSSIRPSLVWPFAASPGRGHAHAARRRQQRPLTVRRATDSGHWVGCGTCGEGWHLTTPPSTAVLQPGDPGSIGAPAPGTRPGETFPVHRCRHRLTAAGFTTEGTTGVFTFGATVIR